MYISNYPRLVIIIDLSPQVTSLFSFPSRGSCTKVCVLPWIEILEFLDLWETLTLFLLAYSLLSFSQSYC